MTRREQRHLDLSVPGRPRPWRWTRARATSTRPAPLAPVVYVFSPTGAPIRDFPTISFPTGIAVDSTGQVYVVNGEGYFGNAGTAEVYDTSGNHLRQLDGNPSKAVSVDPADDHVYVDEGTRVIEFDAAGNQVGPAIGSGQFKGSFSFTVDHGTLVVSNPALTDLVTFGQTALPPEPRTDNPLVIDSVSAPEARHTGDFEVTPSGEQAVFTSTLPLTEYDNAEAHREIFRYDAGTGLDCASCNPTGERASGQASLPANGLGLSDDGRVFFNSDESLVDRDLNERIDAYEWESGKGIQLISTGTSPFAASLLGVSADGVDAYFFTHDTLVPEDANGSRVKVYDARSQGGYPIFPASVPCKASDECHGPGSQAPPPPAIKTIAGTPVGNARFNRDQMPPRARDAERQMRQEEARHPEVRDPRTPRQTRGRESSRPWRWKVNASGTVPRRVLGSMLAAMALLLLFAVLTSTASASEGIASFSVTSSDTQAGGHPDLSTSFRLESPGSPEAAQNVIFNAPEGLFGNPNAVAPCSSSDFALAQCSPDAQVGLVTVFANYEGDPNYLLGTAPIFAIEPQQDQTALFAFIVPTLDIPINIPVAVRTGSDYGLRFTVQNITQTTPLAGADLDFWGFPGTPQVNDPQRFPRGVAGDPSNCPGVADTSCIAAPTESSLPVRPFTDNPTTCTGKPLVTTASKSRPTRTRATRPRGSRATRRPPTATSRSSTRSSTPARRSRQTDSPSGLNIELSAPSSSAAPPRPRRSSRPPSPCPKAFTINPDAADGQSACTDAQANFGTEGPAECPDHAKIGTFQIGTQALDGPLVGSVYIGEPKPGDQYRLFLIADGFGIHAKLVGSALPDARTGQLTIVRRPAPGPVRRLPAAPLRLRPRPDGDADPLHRLHDGCRILPLERIPGRTGIHAGVRPRLGPERHPCPGVNAPLPPATGRRDVEPGRRRLLAFTLKLDRDDGDQFLGDLNFKMPPGFTGDLRGISYCPEARSLPPPRISAAPSRRPQLPGVEPDRHHQRRRRPRLPPVPRGRQDVSRRARSRARR